MRAGCCGSCREGRDPCTMPGTCHRPIVFRTRTPWWRDPETVDAIVTGAKVALCTITLFALALVPLWGRS